MLQSVSHSQPEREENAPTSKGLRIAVIGCGYWGPNLVRNFFEAPSTTVAYACDLSAERLLSIGRRYPGVELTKDYQEVLTDPSIDAIIIATPGSTHYQMARRALEAGKHVWVEKPLALNSDDAQRLTELAAIKRRTLMVDHTFVYTPAVRRMRESIESGELGEILYYDSIRINLGIYQHDVNVIWDLGVHDLAIMDYLVNRRPVGVSAVAARHIGQGGSESIAYVTVHFEDNLLAHFHLNWLAPVKIRQVTVCGTQRMITYDDTVVLDKVRIYDRGVTVHEGDEAQRTRLSVEYRSGDMYAPKLGQEEALQMAAAHFADSVMNGTKPITDGTAGVRIVALAEAAQKSLLNGGLTVKPTY